MLIFCNVFIADINAEKQYYFSPFQEVKYSDIKNFEHFDYVNKDAPKKGKIIIGREGSFTSFNAFLAGHHIDICGVFWTFDRLMMRSFEEKLSYYPLIAESFEILEDGIVFYLNKEAKWSDNQFITAHDVKNTYLNIVENGQMYWAKYFSDIQDVKIIDNHTIKFCIDDKHINDNLLTQIMNLPVLPEQIFHNPYYMERSSGPYRVVDFRTNEFVKFKLNNNYWGRNLPVNVGRFNFEELVCNYCKDNQLLMKIFEHGQFDVFYPKNLQHNIKKSFNNKKIQKLSLNSQGLKRFKILAFNLNSKKFQDIRVRYALNLLLDFEYINKKNFFNKYERADNFLLGWEFLNNDSLSPSEKQILYDEGLLNVFYNQEKIYHELHKKSINSNIDYALSLLQDAGYINKNGALINQENELLAFDLYINDGELIKILTHFIKNCQKIGIQANLVLLDDMLYWQKTRNKEYDIMYYEYYYGRIPGDELSHYLSSSFVNHEFFNPQNIDNKILDVLINKLDNTPNFSTTKDYLNLINKVFVYNYYGIPLWYNPKNSIFFWDKFQIPEKFMEVQYYDEKSMFGIDSWWAK